MAEEAELDVKDTNVESQTTEPESSTAETNDEGIITIDEDGFSAEEAEEADKDGKSEGDTSEKTEIEAPKDEPEESQRKNAETRKQQLNNEIRDKVAERNALKREIAELNRQKYQMKNIDDLPTVEALMDQQNPETGDYYTRTEAKLARIEAERKLEREQRQMAEYVDNIVDNRLRLKDEASQALRDFPMFDEQSPLYNKDLAEKANNIAESMIIKDSNTGEIIGSRGSIYDVYAAIADATKMAEASGKIAGRQAAVKMMNSADVIGSSGANNSADDDNDPFLKGFDKKSY